MDFPICINAIRMGLSIIYSKGSQNDIFLSLKIVLNIAKKYRPFSFCQCTHLGVSSIQRDFCAFAISIEIFGFVPIFGAGVA